MTSSPSTRPGQVVRCVDYLGHCPVAGSVMNGPLVVGELPSERRRDQTVSSAALSLDCPPMRVQSSSSSNARDQRHKEIRCLTQGRKTSVRSSPSPSPEPEAVSVRDKDSGRLYMHHRRKALLITSSSVIYLSCAVTKATRLRPHDITAMPTSVSG